MWTYGAWNVFEKYFIIIIIIIGRLFDYTRVRRI